MEDLNKNIPEKCLMENKNNVNIDMNDDSGEDFDKRDNDYSDSKNNDKRKRRSKNDQNGRKYTCECGKSYLSQPALTNHKKTKHENSHCSTKRGRGRPRKNPCLSSNNKDNNEAKMENFFYDEKRQIREGEKYKASDLVQTVFQEIFVDHRSQLDNKLEKKEDSSFLRMIMNPNDNKNNKSCDQVFSEYLDYLTTMVNKDFFVFAFKFIVLFRECINKYKNVELVNRKCILNEDIPDDVTDYTQQYNADQVPDLCNEFITDFMENADFFGLNSEEERNELIEVIQHFCHWLFKKSYTSSKLTLLS